MNSTSNIAPQSAGYKLTSADGGSQPRSTSKGTKYLFGVLAGLIGAFLYVKAVRLSDGSMRDLTDFDVFHLVGQLVIQGDGLSAYYSELLRPLQQALTGSPGFMPWTYPPPFNLFVALLGFLPVSIAYAIFIGTSLLMFVGVLWALSGARSLLLIALFLPTFLVNIAAGQNGFLTGALAGLTCLYLAKGRAAAGVPLGLLIIKPHLGITLGLFALLDRSRRHAAFVAALIVVLLCGLSTYILGPSIWHGFVHAVAEASQKLATGHYPLQRMVSPYASLKTFGAPAGAAFLGQAVIAAAVSITVLYIGLRKSEARQGLGIAATASVLISPYVYDYDLLVYCIGLALLLPDIERSAFRFEKLTLYVLSFVSAVAGVLQSRFSSFVIEVSPPTIAGIALVVCFLILCRVVVRTQSASWRPTCV